MARCITDIQTICSDRRLVPIRRWGEPEGVGLHIQTR